MPKMDFRTHSHFWHFLDQVFMILSIYVCPKWIKVIALHSKRFWTTLGPCRVIWETKLGAKHAKNGLLEEKIVIFGDFFRLFFMDLWVCMCQKLFKVIV